MSDPKPGHIYQQAKIPLTLTSTSKACIEAEKKPATTDKKTENPKKPTQEIGGPEGPEPTRYGDWERNGRCVDF
ncbi:MAG: succinate dehydrogenase assembly factor 4 [Alphaproteobacteria bacterium]